MRDDDTLDSYACLNEILDRFGTVEALWEEMTRPLRCSFRRWNDGAGVGITEDYNTLYSALVAFAYPRDTHFIEQSGFRMLNRAFSGSDGDAMSRRFPIVRDLLSALHERSISEDFIEVPNDLLAFSGFRFPAHMVLYMLCAAPEVSDQFATDLFVSISLGGAARRWVFFLSFFFLLLLLLFRDPLPSAPLRSDPIRF